MGIFLDTNDIRRKYFIGPIRNLTELRELHTNELLITADLGEIFVVEAR